MDIPPLASSPWLAAHLRALVALVLTGMTCYLALRGVDAAIMALISSYSVLVGMLFGERAALKVPGRDQ